MIPLTTPVAHALASRRRVGRFRLRKPASPVQPRALERQYARMILSAVGKLREIVRERVIPRLAEIVQTEKQTRPDAMDQMIAADMVAELMQATGMWFSESLAAQQIDRQVAAVARGVNRHNEQQFARVLKSVLTVDIILSEPWLEPSLRAFVAEGTDLITKMSVETKDRIAQTVYRDLRQGLRHEEIAKDIEKAFDVSASRARLIGRDQTNKFNGHLTHLRQTEAGIKRYVWTTAGDERVRQSHEDMDGTECDWNDPPEVDGEAVHPGEPINCRCWAKPIFDGLLDEDD